MAKNQCLFRWKDGINTCLATSVFLTNEKKRTHASSQSHKHTVNNNHFHGFFCFFSFLAIVCERGNKTNRHFDSAVSNGYASSHRLCNDIVQKRIEKKIIFIDNNFMQWPLKWLIVLKCVHRSWLLRYLFFFSSLLFVSSSIASCWTWILQLTSGYIVTMDATQRTLEIDILVVQRSESIDISKRW